MQKRHAATSNKKLNLNLLKKEQKIATKTGRSNCRKKICCKFIALEHLTSLRVIPNLNVFRPCDYIETIECWQQALKCKDKPSVIVPLFSIFNLSKLLSALDFSSNSSKADTLPL